MSNSLESLRVGVLFKSTGPRWRITYQLQWRITSLSFYLFLIDIHEYTSNSIPGSGKDKLSKPSYIEELFTDYNTKEETKLKHKVVQPEDTYWCETLL